MQIEVENTTEVQLALDRLVEGGREKAMYRLVGAAIKIARTTGALNKRLHGPLRWAPTVQDGDDRDSVKVGYTLLRPHIASILIKHLHQARAAEWPKALRE